MAAVVYIFSAAQATAKVYWLPDYLKDNADRLNSHYKPDGITPDIKPELECPAGCMTDAEKGSMVCAYTIPVLGVGNCYCNCVEKDICSELKKIEECEYGCAQESISPCSGYCKECYESICDNPDKRPEAIGIPCGDRGDCEEYWEDCPGKCKKAFEDCCEAYADKPDVNGGCEYRCKTPYEAEGCHTKCKECELCPKCGPEYNLSECPANAECDECDLPCENMVVYKFKNCKIDYYHKECFFSQTTAGSKPQLCTWSLN